MAPLGLGSRLAGGQQLPHIPAPSLTVCRPWQRPPCWAACATATPPPPPALPAPPPSPPVAAFCAAAQRCPNSRDPSLSQLVLPAGVTWDEAGTPASGVQIPPSTHPLASSRHAGCLAGCFPSGGGCGSPGGAHVHSRGGPSKQPCLPFLRFSSKAPVPLWNCPPTARPRHLSPALAILGTDAASAGPCACALCVGHASSVPLGWWCLIFFLKYPLSRHLG